MTTTYGGVDLLVTDLIGRWQHFSIPASRLDESIVERGLGFDGSSLRGFQSIDESDMLLRPDLDSARIDPTESEPTLKLICDVHDPVTGDNYTRDPRHVATKAENYLAASGIADKAFFGPELEFFLFDHVQFGLRINSSFHRVESDEADWNSRREEGENNTGYKIPPKQGYTPVSPFDQLSDLRWEMAEKMGQIGIEFEVHHHEVATGGQGEIATRFNTLRDKADETQWYKHIVRNVAHAHGKSATFMPKPLFGDNGTGMHVHQSLWLGDTPLFYDADGYAQLSELARHYIGGLLRHGASLLAFCAPTTNSYKRLVPGFEAPTYLAYSQRNRSAAVRIPTYETSAASKRIEFRPPDPSANTYLAFAAMMMAGLDGVRKPDRPRRPDRCGHLRALSGGRGEHSPGPVLDGGGGGGPRRRPRLPARGRRVHPGRDRPLHRVQGAGIARRVPPPGPRGVPSLLPHLAIPPLDRRDGHEASRLRMTPRRAACATASCASRMNTAFGCGSPVKSRTAQGVRRGV